MRLHVLGFPWSETTDAYGWCGHTSMCGRFATMMHRQGHEVLLYGGEQNDAECTKHFPVVTRTEQQQWFGAYDRSVELGTFPGVWDPTSEWWTTMNARIADEFADADPGDFLCVLAGRPQQHLAAMFPALKTVEYAVGYAGPFAPYRCYASQAWRHYIHGTERDDHGRFFDTVIPHFFDPDDFHVAAKDDYLLYLGRVNYHKGATVAAEIAKATGRRLVVAGQGERSLVPDADFCGVVTKAERADLLARAHAVLMPTLYLEPFGSVAVESMLSGTPVITTNWGALPEIVLDGCGTRGDMLAELVAGVDAPYDHPLMIRNAAIKRFSMAAVGPQYDRWLERLATLDHEGWYTPVGSAHV